MNRALRHTMKVRAGASANTFMDVRFQDTVAQPMQLVQRIYEFIGWPLNDAARTKMQDWLVQDEKSHQGGHEYGPEQFGLSAEQLREDFSEYRTRHIEEPQHG
jgi:hypothetical protein